MSYNSVIANATAEIVIKRSRFIANIAHVESESQAIDFINNIKSKHWDAKHNVYAYRISENNIVRFSDDGEPHSTAGKPVLDILTGNNLINTVIVVTRYFGGVLLGTGGLVRAYSSAAAEAVKVSEIGENKECTYAELSCTYTQFEKMKFIFETYRVTLLDTNYADNVDVEFYLLSEDFEPLIEKITETFLGQIRVKILKKEYNLIKK